MAVAFCNSNPEAITVLVKAGANVNARDNNGCTPLFYAALANSNPEVLTVLVKAGADVNARDKNECTPLMVAALMNPNPKVIITLLNLGVNPKAKDIDGLMAIDHAKENEKLKNTEALKRLEEASR